MKQDSYKPLANLSQDEREVVVKRSGAPSISYPQSPNAHKRVMLPISSATMARGPEFSRLLPFQRAPFFRPRLRLTFFRVEDNKDELAS